MKRQWPFPGDVPVIRARKVALAYRAKAKEYEQIIAAMREALGDKADDMPKPTGDDVAELDVRFRDWGEEWHAEIEIEYGPDDWVKARIGGPLAGLTPHSLGTLRARGRIKGVWTKPSGENGHYLYQVKDLWKLSSEKRGRGWRAKGSTDTVSTDSGSDSD